MAKTNIIVAIVFIVFAILVLFLSNSIPVSKDAPITLDTPMFPRMLSYGIILLSIILILTNWKEAFITKTDNKLIWIGREQLKIVGIGLAIMIASAVVMIYLGFILAMILMNFSYMVFFKVKKKHVLFLEPLLTTLCIYAVFEYVLNVPLPKGILFQ